MPALLIILGIILLIVLVMNIPAKVKGSYYDEFELKASWAFLKFDIFPMSMKKEEKKKKTSKKEKKEPEPEPEVETAEKKENPFMTFYHNQGFDGVITLINNTAKSLSFFLNSLRHHLIIKELYLYIMVTGSDAADTALKYGRICQKVFPSLGFITSNFPVRKYDVSVEPDYLANANKAEFEFCFSIRPIAFTNAVVALAVRLLFKVGIKFLRGIKSKNKKQTDKGGAL